jgi:cytochrome oxidase Cu insertion factor (SCO1/SenC/PrrC family)
VIRFRSPSRRLLGLFVAVPFIAAACTTSASDSADEGATAAAASGAAAPVTEQGEPSLAPATEAGAGTASWLDIELTDAETGEPFSLASLGGEVVAIEPMAIWCSNCRAQQDNVKEVYDQIEASGVTYISLGIDPGENPDSLAAYAERRGYEWTFVQSPVELSRALSDRFGPQILSAPSTPLIVLDDRGEVAFQDFGFHGPEQLLGILEEASA